MPVNPEIAGSLIDTGTIGSVGTLVAATLETLGHYMQSNMIDVLQGGFAGSLGAMLFIFAFITAIVTIGLGGNYKTGLYFFVGTPLFFFLINTRVPSTGVQWQFGNRVHDPKYIEQAREGIIEEGNTPTSASAYSGFGGLTSTQTPTSGNSTGLTREIAPAKVSWFFKEWDRLVSTVVQEFVALVEIVAKDSDLTFVNKMERYEMVNNLSISDPNIKLFTALGVVNKCGEYFALLRYKYDPSIPDLEKRGVEDKLKAYGDQPRVPKEEVPDLRRWLKDSGYEEKVKDIVPADDQPMTCNQIWQMATRIVGEHAETVIDRLVASDLAPQLTPAKVKERLVEKFSRSVDTWNGEVNLSNEQKAMFMVNEASVRMLLRELSSVNPGLQQMEFDKHPRVWRQMGRDIDEDTARSIRTITAKEEWQGKGDFLSAMLTMPYIQGMALYFLAMMFPFFAMALIVPGRHTAILLWMGLWVWVKSWDFGFAIVMLIDEIFYQLMPHGTPMDPETLKDPALAIKTVLQVDPTYSVHTYYNIMATLIAAVPILTGVVVKKGGSEIMNTIQTGFTRFGGKVGGAMGEYQGSLITQSKVGSTDRDRLNAVRSSLQESFWDPTVALPLIAASTAGKGAQESFIEKWGARQQGIVQQLGNQVKAEENTLSGIQRALNARGLSSSDRAILQRSASQSQARLDRVQASYQDAQAKAKPGWIRKIAQDLELGIAKVGIDKMKAVAWAKYKLNVKTADYIAALSEVNQQNQIDAVETRYASHDRIARADGDLLDAKLTWLAEYRSLKLGGEFDKATRNAMNNPMNGEWGLLMNTAGTIVGGYRWLTDKSSKKSSTELPAPDPEITNAFQ